MFKYSKEARRIIFRSRMKELQIENDNQNRPVASSFYSKIATVSFPVFPTKEQPLLAAVRFEEKERTVI